MAFGITWPFPIKKCRSEVEREENDEKSDHGVVYASWTNYQERIFVKKTVPEERTYANYSGETVKLCWDMVNPETLTRQVLCPVLLKRRFVSPEAREENVVTSNLARS